ncbi:methionyl-tRNA synthetase [Methanosalsum zhilinae DSM 4017]|uniref:Methionine--tRNA ligase n=1 Tax=Methanosalsum zhilinae (strain DSM 4017 / NBRC 107636 / OCM 62 / WeN5) TaxID=679901 RepID=F7XKD5_METZD|nr:methionine--tRNA ligase [Methanosalsum zhilinae]AEH61703.1 methionyl-tRNA synthetase [Methanosalsum zhilinae DSM 4017]
MPKFPSDKPVLVTCGLPYANGKAHIGHLRTYVPADIYVRSLKKTGQEVTFVCGSDTHGTPVVLNAEKLGISPKELVEKYHTHFDQIFKDMNVYFDAFGTTDDPENHNRTHEILNTLIDRDYVYPKVIEIAYCPECGRFLPDRYVEGMCPHCGERSRGDECDQGCGKHLEPGELLEPLCTICGGEAQYREQEHYFFKLSGFSDFLETYLNKLEGTINARNYALGWVNKRLDDWCISRTLEWGVPFPGRDDLVVYVWVDAPIGYIAFTEEWANKNNEDWKKFWKGDSRIIHFIGGDIIYHHCIFWPSMLKGAGYTLPWSVVASGMLKIEGKTFSKSRGYVVWVDEDYLEHGFHPDLLRYYLASYTSHTKELNFSWDIFQEKINTELVGVLGNFVYRTLLFAHKNFGQIPPGDIDREVTDQIQNVIDNYREAIDEYEFKRAADTAMSLASYGNTYFQAKEPWKLIKSDKEACGKVIANCIQIVKALAILFEPILPEKMESAYSQLGLEGDIHAMQYSQATVKIEAGTPLPKPSLLFEKIEDEKIEKMEKISNQRIKTATGAEESKNMKKETASKEEITFDDFSKLDLRIGKIISAEDIPKSEKLLKLKVNIGEDEPRQVVAGIKKNHDPENLIGKEIVVLTNLKPVKLCGVESAGMILAAGDDAVLLQPEKDIGPGKRVG